MKRPILLIATLVVAAVAAVAVPNLRHAINRSRQARTLAAVGDIAHAWEARATDTNTYAVGRRHPDPRLEKVTDFRELTPVPPRELQRALVPTYLRKWQGGVDGWGTPFAFAAGDNTYAIRTAGIDHEFDTDRYVYGRNHTFEEDVVYSNGQFIRGPEGL